MAIVCTRAARIARFSFGASLPRKECALPLSTIQTRFKGIIVVHAVANARVASALQRHDTGGCGSGENGRHGMR